MTQISCDNCYRKIFKNEINTHLCIPLRECNRYKRKYNIIHFTNQYNKCNSYKISGDINFTYFNCQSCRYKYYYNELQKKIDNDKKMIRVWT